jgi:hypothetical protein
MKKFYLSKTVAVGALQILSAVLLGAADFVAKNDFSPVAIILFVNGLVMIGLRFLTSEGITL